MSRRSLRIAPLDTVFGAPGANHPILVPAFVVLLRAPGLPAQLGDQAPGERRVIPRTPDEHRLGLRPPLCSTAG
jgi:hypothetical protein